MPVPDAAEIKPASVMPPVKAMAFVGDLRRPVAEERLRRKPKRVLSRAAKGSLIESE
jgi:hypothetical protein